MWGGWILLSILVVGSAHPTSYFRGVEVVCEIGEGVGPYWFYLSCFLFSKRKQGKGFIRFDVSF